MQIWSWELKVKILGFGGLGKGFGMVWGGFEEGFGDSWELLSRSLASFFYACIWDGFPKGSWRLLGSILGRF